MMSGNQLSLVTHPQKLHQQMQLQRRSSENNTIAMNSILSGLLDSEKFKVGQCTSTKEIWDKLQDFTQMNLSS
jgi:hypothetical protein